MWLFLAWVSVSLSTTIRPDHRHVSRIGADQDDLRPRYRPPPPQDPPAREVFHHPSAQKADIPPWPWWYHWSAGWDGSRNVLPVPSSSEVEISPDEKGEWVGPPVAWRSEYSLPSLEFPQVLLFSVVARSGNPCFRRRGRDASRLAGWAERLMFDINSAPLCVIRYASLPPPHRDTRL